MIVDCAVYEEGRRREGHLDLSGAYEAAQEPGSFVWLGLHEPGLEEFDAVAREFNLHELAVEDAVKAHQRPKLEVYDDVVLVVLKTVRYDDPSESLAIGEIIVFVGAGFVIVVRHGSGSALHDVRIRLEQRPDLLRCGPSAVLHAVVDKVVDDYGPVSEGVENDIEEVEADVFSDERTNPAQRIYRLKRQVMLFHRATASLIEPLRQLASGRYEFVPHPLQEYFRDVLDHAIRMNDRVQSFNDLLASALDANLAQVSVRQNDDMRKISAWVAIAAIPTVIGAIYGMNFRHMPELGWGFGYGYALILMAVLCLALYGIFKRAGWL